MKKYSTLIRLTVNQTCLIRRRTADDLRERQNLSAFPKAQCNKLPENCKGQHMQAGRAATGWDLSLLVKGDLLAAIFHHHLVLNLSKSPSLWQHTCASSYQGLWQRDSSSASVALLQSCSDLETTNKSNKYEKQYCHPSTSLFFLCKMCALYLQQWLVWMNI